MCNPAVALDSERRNGMVRRGIGEALCPKDCLVTAGNSRNRAVSDQLVQGDVMSLDFGPLPRPAKYAMRPLERGMALRVEAAMKRRAATSSSLRMPFWSGGRLPDLCSFGAGLGRAAVPVSGVNDPIFVNPSPSGTLSVLGSFPMSPVAHRTRARRVP